MHFKKGHIGVLVILFLMTSQFLFAQIDGCTDPRANNFNSFATQNDGSCTYNKTNVKARDVHSQLPAILLENSGMVFLNGLFWFHNDSGGEAELYGYDTVLNQVVETLSISNALNIDWEDICLDKQFVYVGDFGNNNGDRKDLSIYKIAISSFHDTGATNTTAEQIQFSFPDQIVFSPRSNSHNFDCEAFFSCNDSLYLFSKNWENEWTKVYRLANMPGTQSAELLDSFNVKGLVTAADYNVINKEVVLLGYQNYVPFFWILFDFNDTDFFSGNKRRFDFPISNIGTQTEAVLFHLNNGIYISSEKSSFVTNKLMEIYTWPWTKPFHTGLEDIDTVPILVSPNPNMGNFMISYPEIKDSITEILIYNASGQLESQISGNEIHEGRFIYMHMCFSPAAQYVLIINTLTKTYRQFFQIVN
ncbi:MAG: hypothetical protein HOD63_06825 [Bacteroidetes bacterium]|nr:hypothetical protein [Bacteroidota bacterium]